jgi:hypothetical protein
LRSLKCSCLCLQLQEFEDGRNGFGELVQEGAPIKQLRLESCLLEGDGCPEDDLAAAIAELHELEHLCIKECKVVGYRDDSEYPDTEFCFDLALLKPLRQLTYLELSQVAQLHPRGSYAHQLPGLQDLTRLVDLRLESEGWESLPTDALDGLCSLTRLELSGLSDVDARVLAGKTRLRHLDLPFIEETAELLSQLRHMQQLTHLDLHDEPEGFEEVGAPAADFSAFTASSKLRSLNISGRTVPAGAWKHMFPTGRQLPHLTYLDISEVKEPSGTWAAAPKGTYLVSCCPNLREINMAYLRGKAQLLDSLQGVRVVPHCF